MALAGTRNAKALAWNSGSLEGEAQSNRSRAEAGVQGNRQGGWVERSRKNHTQGQKLQGIRQGRAEGSHWGPRQDSNIDGV